MSWIQGMAQRARELLRPHASELEIDEELRDHFEREVERRIRAGAAPDAADTAAPTGMLRSSQSCDALKRVQPATVARGASSFHFGWNGGRCSCATLSNIVSTSSDRRR